MSPNLHHDANELTAINGIAVTHEDGNQLDTGTHRLVFNNLGQVTQLLDPGTAEVLEQYQYDADGLRIAKLNATNEVLEKYFYNGGKLSYVTDGSDKLLYYFTRSTSGALLSMVDCTGATKVAYWYVKDAHGNVVGLTDASGTSVVSYAYDAWGNETSSTGTVKLADQSKLLKDANPFRYAGYYYDTDTGLYYLKARYYSPELGRFLSRDPVRGDLATQLTLNPYAYALNNPTGLIDPEGLSFALPLAFGGPVALTLGLVISAVLAYRLAVQTSNGSYTITSPRVLAKSKRISATLTLRHEAGSIFWYAIREPLGGVRPMFPISREQAIMLLALGSRDHGVWTQRSGDAESIARAAGGRQAIEHNNFYSPHEAPHWHPGNNRKHKNSHSWYGDYWSQW